VRSLSALIRGRHQALPEGSYTTRLFLKGPKAIGKKVVEEAGEAVIEAVDGNRDRFIYEASDLVYHLLVTLERYGVTLDELAGELNARMR
jgi:phosphoribosyl-ATP pyrophosphohydrolase